MSSNMSLLRKADIAIADLQANGGELQPEEGASFVRKLIVQPTLLKQTRLVEMNASKRKVNKIGFGTRILRKAQSGVALTEAQRSKPVTSQISLSTEEQIAEVRLPYDVLEDNIERATAANNEAANTGPGGLRQTIIDLIAEQAALDLEELALLATTDYTNPGNADDEAYMAQLDGWIKLGEDGGHVVDVNGDQISKAVFKAGSKAMPDAYLRNKSSMMHFVSYDNETEYRDTLANRGTAMGDSLIQGGGPVFAYGSPVQGVALMPGSKGMYMNPKNLIFGIQRQVSMEFDKDITERVYIIVLTCRVAFQIEEADALVVYDNIAA